MVDTALTRKRGSLKASLTSFAKYVKTCQQAGQTLSDIQIINLRERLARMQDVFTQFNEVQGDIEGVIEENELNAQYEERFKFEDTYYECVAIAKLLLPVEQGSDEASVDGGSHVSQHSSGSIAAGTGSQMKIAVKLPDIPLPGFDGSFEGWLEFRDTFESLINSNGDLSDIQKFHYLRASLKGKVAELIRSVEFTEQGYSTAWSTLIDRFNNSKLLIHNHLKAIFSLDTINKESSHNIRNLIDQFSKHLSSVKQLGRDTHNWDTLLIFMLSSRLDNKTAIDWEKFSMQSDSPTLLEFITFLKNKANVLETIEQKSDLSKVKHIKEYHPKIRQAGLVGNRVLCYFCNCEHSIYFCDKFATLSHEEKLKFIKAKKLCINCLRDNHIGKKCVMGRCRKCNSFHNTLLHRYKQPFDNKKINDQENEREHLETEQLIESTTSATANKVISRAPNYVFLSTARIKVFDRSHKVFYARALLDSGSQSSFVSADLCERLSLKESQTNVSVVGLANRVSSIKSKCSIRIASLYNDFEATLTCYVLPQVTSISVAHGIEMASLDIPSNLKLADPEALEPGPIDVLIGADVFWSILRHNKISLGKGLPTLQSTQLGWILIGMMALEDASNGGWSNPRCNTANLELEKSLTRFWEIEEVSSVRALSRDEIDCENIFTETTSRDEEGRFIATLPLKQPAEALGDSRKMAEKRFYSTERKLSRNESLKEYYVDFMAEYERLGHMSVSAPDSVEGEDIEYYMPHHGVLRETSLTTKLRVVFDASAPSSNGLSLNDIQRVGPVLQDDLFSILIRFRKHAFVVSADIAKMYRQVLVEPSQRKLQKILWRACPNEDLKTYELNTVTYGQASASYLAIRCLFELADECEETIPAVAEVIRHDFYVDDLLTGAESIQEAERVCHEVSIALKKGCFELRKWQSNEPEILKDFASTDVPCGVLQFSPSENSKVLGLTWASHDDVLLYKIEDSLDEKGCTKRNVLSFIAKIFDPLGLLTPCTVLTKIFMQRLWSSKLSWDDLLPESLNEDWSEFCRQLPKLNFLKVKRHAVLQNSISVQIHGFADASERAYGACIYLRSTDQLGNVKIALLCAKSRVSPMKTVTIPKLELCGALLLARLTSNIVRAFRSDFERCVLWSDSTIVLAWLKTSPSCLRLFVGNRVAEIQALTDQFV